MVIWPPCGTCLPGDRGREAMLRVCERIAEDRQHDRSVRYPPDCGCMDLRLGIAGGALAGFSKHRWPADGPARELLGYLDDLHRAQGQPSMARIAKAVGLVAGTVSRSEEHTSELQSPCNLVCRL